ATSYLFISSQQQKSLFLISLHVCPEAPLANERKKKKQTGRRRRRKKKKLKADDDEEKKVSQNPSPYPKLPVTRSTGYLPESVNPQITLADTRHVINPFIRDPQLQYGASSLRAAPPAQVVKLASVLHQRLHNGLTAMRISTLAVRHLALYSRPP
ncbi:hypothetical protein TSAR_004049, partial [Trichomalopsis sarcophagae]